MLLPSMTGMNRLQLLPGLLFVAAITACASALATTSLAERFGLGTLTLAILLGMGLGSLRPLQGSSFAEGVAFAKSNLLRLGIVLYGLRISFHDIAIVGWQGTLLSAVMVGFIFLSALYLGTRLLGIDRDTAVLIGAGSAICGAAAVMATAPVIRGSSSKVAVAVATVVVFGTLSMFLYPLLYPHLGLNQHAYGLFVGSTVHEVAQVVIAGEAVGEEAAATAVIVKMLRVMMLVPFLLLLSRHACERQFRQTGVRPAIRIPWFALAFLAVAGLNSFQLLPPVMVSTLLQLGMALLAMAMAGLGLSTTVGAFASAGVRPLLLAGALFLLLTLCGYVLNAIVRMVF